MEEDQDSFMGNFFNFLIKYIKEAFILNFLIILFF